MPEIEYVWDELSDNVIEEYEDGVLSVSYDHEPGLYGNLLSQNRNGVTSYYHYDGRGDTVALTDDSGDVTDTNEYDAFGNVIASTGSTATPYQFIGQQGYQTESTGVNVKARLYQPTVGRWKSILLLSNGLIRPLAPYSFQPNNFDSISSSDDVNIILEPHSSSGNPIPLRTTCSGNGRVNASWKFKLSRAAPCNGFIVQKVQVSCEIDACNGDEIQHSAFHYFEAWRVAETKDRPLHANHGQDTAIINFDKTYRLCRKGIYTQYSEIRFYCNIDVGLTIEDQGRTIPGWDHNDQTPAYYGEGICRTTAGSLTSSGNASFWKTNGEEDERKVGTPKGAAGRQFNVTWKCCQAKKPCCGDGTNIVNVVWSPRHPDDGAP